MGCRNGSCYREPPQNSSDTRREVTIAEFKQSICTISMSRIFTSRRLQEFHNQRLPDLIYHHHKPKMIQRTRTHYETFSQMQSSNVRETSVKSNDAYTQLRSIILEQQGSFFGFILRTYFRFIESLFLVEPDTLQVLSQPINHRCNFLPSTLLTKS